MNYQEHMPSSLAFAMKAGLSPEEAAVLPAVFNAAAIVGGKEMGEIISRSLSDDALEEWVTTHTKLVAREMSK